MQYVKIAGLGSYLPSRVVTNGEIAAQIDSSDEWIFSHTGISSRHVAGPDETACSLATEAARRALAAAGAAPEEIGLVVLATTTPDFANYPSTACLVQYALGCRNAAAFDLAAACSGFMYGVEMAKGHLLQHPGRKALVIGVEVLSRQIDWTDRSHAMLFGDGAGAAVLVATDEPPAFPSVSTLGADGSGADFIRRKSPTRRQLTSDPVHVQAQTAAVPYLEMDGHAVFTFAVRKLDEIICDLCKRGGTNPGALDLIVPHQANLRIIDAVARRMKLPLEKFYINLRELGNTSSASIPLALEQAVREGALKPGMRLALAGFGSGLTWAGDLVSWPYV